MKKIFILTGIIIFITAFKFVLPDKETPANIRTAVQNSLNLLQKSSHEFIENAGCVSCHGQFLGIIAFTYGRDKGFAISDSIYTEAQQTTLFLFGKRQSDMIEQNETLGGDISNGFALWSMGVSKCSPDKTTDFLTHDLLERQTKDGHWVGGNGRAPLEYYSFDATAMAIYGINHYKRPGFAKKVKDANEKAIAWLTHTTAINNEEKAFQLLGLTWANADPEFIQKRADILLRQQHVNGGWSQLDSLGTDAYATGQSLYALVQCGRVNIMDSAFQRGVAYLLSTQHEDGSWKIISRSHPFLPHVTSGFPYGSDQFISAAGTNWATIALLQTF